MSAQGQNRQDTRAERVGIRALRTDLASLVRRAGAGDRLVITIAGRPIAAIGPVGEQRQASLLDLVAVGLVEAPLLAERPAAPPPVAVPVDRRLADVVAQVRGR